jgi:hypothetical protein
MMIYLKLWLPAGSKAVIIICNFIKLDIKKIKFLPLIRPNFVIFPTFPTK